jgi:hypothetical protein
VLVSGYGDIDDRLHPVPPTLVEHVVNKPWQCAPMLAAMRALLEPSDS